MVDLLAFDDSVYVPWAAFFDHGKQNLLKKLDDGKDLATSSVEWRVPGLGAWSDSSDRQISHDAV